jgi:endonuclease G
MEKITPAEMARAERVLDRVLDDWLLRPGVTAVDLGYEWAKGEMTGRLAIRVHVAKKKPAIELDDAEIFPREVDGIPVDVLQASYGLPATPQLTLVAAPAPTLETSNEISPAAITPLGVSVSNPYTSAGTLGALVVDIDTGREMVLSNWHVLGGMTDTEAGTPIWQPGSIDGGTAQHKIGHLTRWTIGPYDAAVALLDGSRNVEPITPDGRPIEKSGDPMPGMTVWKYGRTSGYTKGFIDGTHGTVPLTYPTLGATVVLQDIVRIIPLPGDRGEISEPGDSGAVWVDEESGMAVGLHCAGETGFEPEYALAHDIGPVLRTLFVRFPGDYLFEVDDDKLEPPGGDGDDSGPVSWWAGLLILVKRMMRSKNGTGT